MTRKSFIAALGAGLLGAAALSADEVTARKAAETWLEAHDEGRYAETWDASADFVKQQIPKQKWEAMMRGALEPFGKLKSRSLQSSSPTRELPGMADGDYVVLVYEAQFEHKANAIETVIPMLEDGKWKVMTYRIR